MKHMYYSATLFAKTYYATSFTSAIIQLHQIIWNKECLRYIQE